MDSKALYLRKKEEIKENLASLHQEVIDTLYLIDHLKDDPEYANLLKDEDYELLCNLYFRLPGKHPVVSESIKEKIESSISKEETKEKVLSLGKPKVILS